MFPYLVYSSYTLVKQLKLTLSMCLKVHKRETFVGSDFEFFTIFAFSMFKY